jgi:hypothetical protein
MFIELIHSQGTNIHLFRCIPVKKDILYKYNCFQTLSIRNKYIFSKYKFFNHQRMNVRLHKRDYIFMFIIVWFLHPVAHFCVWKLKQVPNGDRTLSKYGIQMFRSYDVTTDNVANRIVRVGTERIRRWLIIFQLSSDFTVLWWAGFPAFRRTWLSHRPIDEQVRWRPGIDIFISSRHKTMVNSVVWWICDQQINVNVRTEVLTVMTLNNLIFWVVILRNLKEIDDDLRGVPSQKIIIAIQEECQCKVP